MAPTIKNTKVPKTTTTTSKKNTITKPKKEKVKRVPISHVPISEQIVILSKDDQKATVKGSSGSIYHVTPFSCECKDHTMRKKKCKHMSFVFPI